MQANYDIRTIQELLGYSDIRTTMIYTPYYKNQQHQGGKKPLEFLRNHQSLANMYFLDFYYQRTNGNQVKRFSVSSEKKHIPKWTILKPERTNKRLLQLIVLSLSGKRFIGHIPISMQQFCPPLPNALHLEWIKTRHVETDGRYNGHTIVGAAMHVFANGDMKKLPHSECMMISDEIPLCKMANTPGLHRDFLLAYGSEWTCHNGTDDFDFNNPNLKITHYHSLFDKHAALTDPVEYLTRLYHRGVRYKRFHALNTIKTICVLFKRHLNITTANWMNSQCDFHAEWKGLHPWQRRMILPVLDACRHLLDAFPKSQNPLETRGVMIFHRPDVFCETQWYAQWLRMLDRMFPRMQFVITVSERKPDLFPSELFQKRLPLADDKPRLSKEKKVKIKKGTILLIHVDGSLPNLALMKLSQHYKSQGFHIRLLRGSDNLKVRGSEAVFASCVFNFPQSLKRVKELKDYYGDSLIIGGSGVDLKRRLSEHIENLPADYDLYPELADRAIGFITRGCPSKCPFCIVPVKEGKVRHICDIKTLLDKNRSKLILLDDNILSHPNAGDFLEEMASRNLRVNFNQTLDIHRLDREKARLLRRIHASNVKFTRKVYYFSCNDNRKLASISRNYKLMDFTQRDNVEFICMYGYNTTLSEDVDRFRFLRSLPGAYVFVQQYQPIIGGPDPALTSFFDDQADNLINELVGILFPQNMKSMEKYYRWVSKKYLETFGKLHMGLVDFIFRYNRRHLKGDYIKTLAGTRKPEP